jgi:uroporphyrinogen-III synthase
MEADRKMNPPLAGRTVALAEGRQLEDLAQMLEKEGASVLRCPMLSILDAPDAVPILAWLRELTAGRFGWVVLLTGEGLRRLLGFADREGLREAAVVALGRTRTVTRGPKPVRALKDVGLSPAFVAEAPTTEGVIATLKQQPLAGAVVGVQLYSESNPPLTQFLEGAGAVVRTVLPYVYAPATDAEHVAELIGRMAGGGVDVAVFTSAPQVDRLFEVAAERGVEAELKRGLERVQVAAVGPVVADSLRRRGARVDICPEQGFQMKNLVLHIKRHLGNTESGSATEGRGG